jgi:hypothetical protein
MSGWLFIDLIFDLLCSPLRRPSMRSAAWMTRCISLEATAKMLVPQIERPVMGQSPGAKIQTNCWWMDVLLPPLLDGNNRFWFPICVYIYVRLCGFRMINNTSGYFLIVVHNGTFLWGTQCHLQHPPVITISLDFTIVDSNSLWHSYYFPTHNITMFNYSGLTMVYGRYNYG